MSDGLFGISEIILKTRVINAYLIAGDGRRFCRLLVLAARRRRRQHDGHICKIKFSTSDIQYLNWVAVAGRAEVLSPSSFWLRAAAGADLTDAWMCYRSWNTDTRVIRTLDEVGDAIG